MHVCMYIFSTIYHILLLLSAFIEENKKNQNSRSSYLPLANSNPFLNMVCPFWPSHFLSKNHIILFPFLFTFLFTTLLHLHSFHFIRFLGLVLLHIAMKFESYLTYLAVYCYCLLRCYFFKDPILF